MNIFTRLSFFLLLFTLMQPGIHAASMEEEELEKLVEAVCDIADSFDSIKYASEALLKLDALQNDGLNELAKHFEKALHEYRRTR